MKLVFSYFSSAVLLAAVASWVTFGQQPASSDSDPGSACSFSIPSSKMSVCFNIDGNIMQLESPTGQEHVRVGAFVEGYILCPVGFASSWDVASAVVVAGATSGFGGSITLNGLPQPVTVRRDTTTGSTLRLTQEIARDTNERDVSVIMTVTNLSTTTSRTVRMDRIMDIDANGSTSNTFVKDRDTIYGFNATLDGVSLNNVQFPVVPHATSVQTFAAFDPRICNQASVALPATGDHIVRLSYDLGVIAPLSSKVVKIYYRRQ